MSPVMNSILFYFITHLLHSENNEFGKCSIGNSITVIWNNSNNMQ